MSIEAIVIDATIQASPEQVWEYWTAPEHITQWNFASEDWHCPNASNDVRVGGTLKSRMEAKDGSFGFDFEATYSRVEKPQILAYSLGDGRAVTTHFEELDGATKVTTHFEPEDSNSAEMQRTGWQAILNNFKKYVEANQ